MRDHTKLRAFELADRLAVAVYQLTRAFPADEQFGLTSQMRRATVSVASNIVEGCARSTQPEYVRFLDIAYGSAREVEYQLSLASRLGYAQEESFPSVTDLADETGRVLSGLIRSLRKN
jgi:four helix bundle protein